MRIRVATAVVASFILTVTPVLADGVEHAARPIAPYSGADNGAFGFRNSPEARPFHACLYANYIYRYCRIHYWDSISDCMISHRACGCPADTWFFGWKNDACAAAFPAEPLITK
jgi:hypothetical protein